jgi:hypothetical protein
MMKNIFLKTSILSLVLLINTTSCNSEQPIDADQIKDTMQRSSIIEPRKFDAQDQLFLTFYRGMNKAEYKFALENLMKEKKVSLRKTYDDYIKEYKDVYRVLIDEQWMDKKRNIKNESDYIGHFTIIYYKMNINKETYYANLSAFFNENDELIKISLRIPCFAKTDTDNVFNENPIKIAQNVKDEIISLYTEKYGKPSKTFSKESNGTLNSLLEHDIKPYKITFKDEHKVISISPSCCVTYEPIITYQLISDAEKHRINLINKEKNEKKLQDSLKRISLKEI